MQRHYGGHKLHCEARLVPESEWDGGLGRNLAKYPSMGAWHLVTLLTFIHSSN